MTRMLLTRISAAAIVAALGGGALAMKAAPSASGAAQTAHETSPARVAAQAEPEAAVTAAMSTLLIPEAAAATLEPDAPRTITVAAASEEAGSAGTDAGLADAVIDPPGRVGRLSHIEGAVSFHAKEQDQWAPATLNFPVTSGDSFWTEADARAEIQVGGVALRMAKTTEITVARLDDDATQFEVLQGTVNLTVATLPEGGVTLGLPLGELRLTQPGRYRIDAGTPYFDAPPEQIQVTVFEGEARFDAEDGTQVIESGQSFTASGDPLTFAAAAVTVSDFDAWAQSRDPQPAAPAAATGAVSDSPEIVWNGDRVAPTAPRSSPTLNYVSPETTGYQDLDVYGSWTTTADYGPVWYPDSVPYGWAPYRHGHWAYVSPWGWTWIDDAPWGFAPFHYGRWVFAGSRWGWCPGYYVPRPVYAPALVAFIGGHDWGIGISLGGVSAIGWVPLSPYDHYRPYYRASRKHAREVNITNITVNKTVINNNITVVNGSAETFANRRGATVVSTRAFTGGARVERARLNLRERDFDRARVRDSLAELRPSAAARRGITAPGPAQRLPVTARGGRGEAIEAALPTAPGPQIRPTRADRRAETAAGSEAERRDVRQETRSSRIERRNQRNAPAAAGVERRDSPRTGRQALTDTRSERGPAGQAATRPAARDRTARAPITPQRDATPPAIRRGATDDVKATRAERRAARTAKETAKETVKEEVTKSVSPAARPPKPLTAAKPVTAAKRPAAKGAPATENIVKPSNTRETGRRDLRADAPNRVGDTAKRTPTRAARQAEVRAAPRPAPPARIATPKVQRVQPPVREAKPAVRSTSPAVRSNSPAVRSAKPVREASTAPRRVIKERRATPNVRAQRERAAPAVQAARPAPKQAAKQAPQRVQAAPAPQVAAAGQARRQSASERKARQQTRREAQEDRRNARGPRFDR